MKIAWNTIEKAQCYVASLVIHIAVIIILSFIILIDKSSSTGEFKSTRGFLTASGISEEFETMGAQKQIQTATISVQSLVKPTESASHPRLAITSPVANLPTVIEIPQATSDPILQNFDEGKARTGNGNGAGSLWTGVGAASGSGKKINFFGIQDEAEKVVFLVDISGSMISTEKGGCEGFHRVKEELHRLLDGLHIKSSFNVVLFGNQAFCLQSQSMLQATPENKESAYQMLSPIYASEKNPNSWDENLMKFTYTPTIRGLPIDGGTRIDLALLAAFEMKPDVIFVISDGAPQIAGWTTGEVFNKVYAWKKQIFLNQKEPKIHVVSYEADGGGDNFMQSLASRHSGKFLRIKGFKKQQITFAN